VNSLEGFYVRVLAPPVVAILVSFLMWFLLGMFSWTFSLVLLGGFLFGGIVVPLFVQNKAKQLSMQIIQLRTRLSETTIDIVQGLPELKLFNQTQFFLNKFDQINSQVVEKQHRLKKLISNQQSAITFVMNVTLFVMLLVAIPQVSASVLDGVFLSVIILGTMAAFEAIQPIPAAVQDLQSSLQAAERLFDFVKQKPEEQTTRTERSDDAAIQFKNISFKYENTNVLKDVSFSIANGEKVAIVGPSGSGKSTLINLLLGFWQPQQGSVLLDSKTKIAVMSQNSYLFNNTMRENLLLAYSEATDEQIKDAVKKAGLWELIENLPNGLDTWLGEHGHTISGGEKQRLSIARTLLQNSPIQIYDEPTAHLDLETEMNIIFNLLNQPEQTVILLTHRFVGLEKVDKILVLQNEKIVELGTPVSLVKTGGLYADMLRIQNGYFQK
jgi:ATP-binding cassette, subfamily C, bacterial CydC